MQQVVPMKHHWPMQTQHSSSPSKVVQCILFAMALGLSACSTLEPKSQLDLPFKDAKFREQSNSPQNSAKQGMAVDVPHGAWWEVFGDEQLNSLVTDAIQNNKDLEPTTSMKLDTQIQRLPR